MTSTTIVNTTLKICLVLIAVGALVGCGSSKTGGDGYGSTDNPSNDTNSTPPDIALAICSQDMSGVADLQVRLMQYSNASGQARPDFVRLKFSKIPSGWEAAGWDMMIYRWSAAPDNSTSLDSTPLFYQFEKKTPAGFDLISSNSYKYFSFDEAVALAEYNNQYEGNIQISASSAAAFASSVSLLVNVTDTTNSFQVLRVVFKQGSTIKAQANVLIPTFQADPAKYNADPRHPAVLKALHPLKDKLGQNWSDLNYYEFAKAFCF
ncbi:MAG: hypothetical protein ACAH59_08250 [Pseudobdellovibrionaceae bacterium]